jgi:hypothetical protein
MTRSRLALDVLLGLAGLYVVLVGLLGFFGQAFFGRFSLVETAVSISGFLAVLFAAACRGVPKCRAVVVLISAVSLTCVALDVIEHYRYYDIPGSSYAWDMQIPYVVCIVLVACAGVFAPSEPRA